MKSADSLSLNRFVHTFGDSLREKYGENVYKISLSGNFTCPNRDGTLGRGGCTFCSVASFAGSPARKSLREQLLENRNPRARLFLAYFQAYTSTYAEFAVLKKCYDEALASPEVIGLCVGTRPDCVSDEILGLLEDYGKQGFEVWLELGLQSSFDETLERINRRHTFADYIRTAVRARKRGIRVCAHIIVGLPGEGLMHSLTTLGRVLDIGADALKLHQLHIVRGSQMEREYRRGEIAVLSLEEYARIAALMIQHTPENVLYERVGASALSGMLVAPDWAAKRWPVINAITAVLAREGGQGSRVRYA